MKLRIESSILIVITVWENTAFSKPYTQEKMLDTLESKVKGIEESKKLWAFFSLYRNKNRQI